MDYSKLDLTDKYNNTTTIKNLSIKNVINGNLDENAPREELFVGLENTTLRNHQKTLLYHMKKIENDSAKAGSGRFSISTNIGVVGDVVGSGKSLPVLLLILNNQLKDTVKERYVTYSNTAGITVIDYKSDSSFSHGTTYGVKPLSLHSSLLVVPHTLVRQWKSYIDTYVPSLQYKVINKAEHVQVQTKDKEGKITSEIKSIQDLVNKQLLIISSTFYSTFMKLYIGGRYMWDTTFDRVIFDEADSINIPNCYKPKAKFYWFVTSSVLNLMCPVSRYFDGKYIDGIRCSGFIKNLFQELDTNSFPFYDHIFFKNKDSFIQASFELPKPIMNMIPCYTPKAVKVLKGILDDKIIQMIQGDDLKGAMEQVGSMNLIKSSNDIIKISTNMLVKELDNKEKQYKYQESLTYATPEGKTNALKNTQNKIDEIKNKIKLIEQRVQNKFCLVCNGDAEIPTITMCCKNVFCLNCIQCSYKMNPSCPFCRAQIKEKDIVIQADMTEPIQKEEKEEVGKPKLLNKIDMLFKIIKDNPDGKFLVVSLYENSLGELHEKFQDKEIKSTRLAGNNLVVNSLLNKFKDPESDLNVILLNASNYGSGLNIPETTDIIIYHKLTKELETQVIGRAQRYGRIGPLRVHYLTHDGEYDDNSPTTKW